ncbi:MAG: hypothetical protein Q8L14_12725 [Myxococcales bacterium]|nr:hypothetical protein [Myxococcales bacterium]
MRRTLGVMFLAWGAACTCQKEMPDGKDVTAPTWPPDAVITLTDVTETGATASWPDASDDVGVTGYIVEKEGQRLAETTTPTFALTGLAVGTHERLTVKARDAAGNESPLLTAEAGGAPRFTLPSTDESISTDFCAAMQFFFTGASAPQQGADASKLSCDVIAAIHGRALTPSGTVLPGVRISIHGRPELGSTFSRADGAFDLVVPAGQHTVTMAAPAFLTAQRQVLAVKGRFQQLEEDVVLLRVDEKSTAVALPAGGFHEASSHTDESGSRVVRLFIPPGTTAVADMPDGTTRPLSTVTLRVTEYTVGQRGPQAMPASLPGASAYTFAAEFSVDEARAMGAAGVTFSQPVAYYVDNFLSAPVGSFVPRGSYRPAEAQWKAGSNGLVVQALAGGLDVTGDGAVDSEMPLLAGEADVIASKLTMGNQYVRAETTHFSTDDDNYAWVCSGTCAGSGGKVPGACPGGCKETGSIIDVQNQTVSESVSIPGTGIAAFLHSHRQPRPSFSLDVPLLTGADGGVKGASAGRVVLEVGGRQMTVDAPDAGEGEVVRVSWDGKDAFGRTVRGPVNATVKAGFVYGGMYVRTGGTARRGGGVTTTIVLTPPSFAAWPPIDGVVEVGPTRQKAFISKSQEVLLGNWTGPEALGGLSLGILHGYSASTGTLYTGTGDTVRTSDLGATVQVFAGGGNSRLETGPAKGAGLNQPSHLVAGADGSLYFVDNSRVVRKLSADGATLSSVAGNLASRGFGGDDADAKAALFSGIDGLAVTPAGDLYIADTDNQRIRRVDGKSGIVTTVVGSGMRGVPAVGDSPTATKLDAPKTLLVSRDGSLYFFAFGGGAVGDILFKLTTDGRLEKAAGGASSGGSTPLEAASPFGVSFSTFGKRMAEGPDGSLYITDNRATLRRIAPDGRVSLVAGGGTSVEDGVSGSAVRFADVMGVAADAEGRVYVADRGGSGMRPGGRVRVIGVDGRISTVAGDGTLPLGRTPDVDMPGPAARLGQTREVVALADGRVLFAEAWFGTVQVLQPQRGLSLGERAVGSGDGSELYVFDPSGRHLRTIETLTGAVSWRFVWNGQGQLGTIVDRNGDETQVLRDGQGRFAGFRAKDGHVLTATVDESGRLKSLVDGRMRTVKVGWNAAGLPESWEDANGTQRASSTTPMAGWLAIPTRSGTKSDWCVSRCAVGTPSPP